MFKSNILRYFCNYFSELATSIRLLLITLHYRLLKTTTNKEYLAILNVKKSRVSP